MVEYTYCPYCGVPLVKQEEFGALRPTCPQCGYIQFLDPKVAVIGLVTSAERVLLIRRGVDPAKGKWALPGGYMDAGELPEEALQRELTEEVGLQVQVLALLGIYRMVTRPRVAGGIVIAYEAAPVGGGLPSLRCDDDVVEAHWFAADQLPNDIAFESSEDLLATWRRDATTTTKRINDE